jgi:hypothetical protein
MRGVVDRFKNGGLSAKRRGIAGRFKEVIIFCERGNLDE